MIPRPNSQKINIDDFKHLFYERKLSNKEIANYFGVKVVSLGSFRRRHCLPGRGWSKHPMLGKKHSKKSKDLMSKNRSGKNDGCNH